MQPEAGRFSLMAVKSTMTRRYGIPVLLFLALLSLLQAQRADFSQSNYSKHEFRIPMRDGKKLFTAVYQPKDTSRKYPIMLQRTPYSVAPYGEDNYPLSVGPSDELAEEGFIFAYQDVRGAMMSEGEFINMTPHHPDKKGPGISTNRPTPATRSTGWLKIFPTTTARSACGGSPIRDFSRRPA